MMSVREGPCLIADRDASWGTVIDAEAARLGHGVLLAVRQLAGGADRGVTDHRTGPHGRFQGLKGAGGLRAICDLWR